VKKHAPRGENRRYQVESQSKKFKKESRGSRTSKKEGRGHISMGVGASKEEKRKGTKE